MQWFKLFWCRGIDDYKWGGAGHACTGEPFVRMLVACSLSENALWYVERWVEWHSFDDKKLECKE